MKADIHSNEYTAFYKHYIDLAPDFEMIESLKKSEYLVINVFQELTEKQLHFRYAENKWTPKEMLLHIIDTERIMAYRALRIARNDMTPLSGFDENEYVLPSNANDRSPESLIQEFRLQRESTSCLFTNLPNKSLSVIGNASGKPISARALAYVIAGHEIHHLNVLKERYL